MPRFKPYDYDQHALVAINYLEQLQPGTFEHAVHYLIEHKLDLSVFHPRYHNDATGRCAYDPAILLKIILFTYFILMHQCVPRCTNWMKRCVDSEQS